MHSTQYTYLIAKVAYDTARKMADDEIEATGATTGIERRKINQEYDTVQLYDDLRNAEIAMIEWANVEAGATATQIAEVNENLGMPTFRHQMADMAYRLNK